MPLYAKHGPDHKLFCKFTSLTGNPLPDAGMQRFCCPAKSAQMLKRRTGTGQFSTPLSSFARSRSVSIRLAAGPMILAGPLTGVVVQPVLGGHEFF